MKNVKNELFKIAIVGAMGSGKSYVLNYIKQKNFVCFDCDLIVANLYNYSQPLINDLANINCDLVLNNKVDKNKIFYIFNNDFEQKKIIEKCVFKHVYNFLNLVFTNMLGTNLCFVEVPLLFESNGEQYFDQIVYVDRNKELRFETLIKNRGYSYEWLNKQNSFLIDENIKKNKSDFILENNESLEKLNVVIDNYLLRLKND